MSVFIFLNIIGLISLFFFIFFYSKKNNNDNKYVINIEDVPLDIKEKNSVINEIKSVKDHTKVNVKIEDVLELKKEELNIIIEQNKNAIRNIDNNNYIDEKSNSNDNWNEDFDEPKF